MKKGNKRFRDESIRHPNWNYAWNGAYFVTICTKNRIRWFGDVKNGKMILSDIGKQAHNPKTWDPLSGDLKLGSPNMQGFQNRHLHGNPGIMIISSGI